MELQKKTPFANDIIENIWTDRYQKNGESYVDALRRVADFCSKYDSYEEKNQSGETIPVRDLPHNRSFDHVANDVLRVSAWEEIGQVIHSYLL